MNTHTSTHKINKTIKPDIKKLRPYDNNQAHFRMVREEIKKAAQDDKTKLAIS